MQTPTYDRALRDHGAALIRRSRSLRTESKALREDARRLLAAIGHDWIGDRIAEYESRQSSPPIPSRKIVYGTSAQSGSGGGAGMRSSR
jgi:hypothetical protein